MMLMMVMMMTMMMAVVSIIMTIIMHDIIPGEQTPDTVCCILQKYIYMRATGLPDVSKRSCKLRPPANLSKAMAALS